MRVNGRMVASRVAYRRASQHHLKNEPHRASENQWGRVSRYRVNPHVAWHGDLDVRKEQAEQIPLPLTVPLLTVIDGGKE